MPFLIDGHNIIAAMESIELDDPNDEAKLVMKLRAWFSHIQRKAVLVFDGGVPGGPSPTLSTADIKVIFAARHHTIADRIIRERLGALPDAANWTVISSDHEVLDAARSTGAKTMTAQEFADMIEHPPEANKEKPDAISAAEVQSWLQIFPEPEERTVPASQESAAKRPDTKKPTGAGKKRSRSAHQAPVPQPIRSTRSIGEQMGLDVKVLPESPSGKPTEISNREVDAWLQVFHDDPNSKVPPPNLPKPKRRKKTPKPQEAVVRKTGELSSEEVDAWLSVFEEPGAQTGDASESSGTAPKPRGNRRTVNTRLAKQHQNLAPVEGEGKADLPQEDLELWHRLFGEE